MNIFQCYVRVNTGVEIRMYCLITSFFVFALDIGVFYHYDNLTFLVDFKASLNENEMGSFCSLNDLTSLIHQSHVANVLINRHALIWYLSTDQIISSKTMFYGQVSPTFIWWLPRNLKWDFKKWSLILWATVIINTLMTKNFDLMFNVVLHKIIWYFRLFEFLAIVLLLKENLAVVKDSFHDKKATSIYHKEIRSRRKFWKQSRLEIFQQFFSKHRFRFANIKFDV